MTKRDLAGAAATAAFIAVLGLAVDAVCQRIHEPEASAVPGVRTSTTAPAASKKSFGCSDITDEVVERLLKARDAATKAHEADHKAYEAEMAKAKAKRDQADAIQSKRGQQTVNTIMQTADCKDAFKEKDARAKEIARLEDQVAAADSAGDERKSEALHKKLDPLNEALELDADRACGGKGSAALHDCLEQKKAALAKQGIAEPMLTIQAQGECMSDPSTSGFAGATGESQEEKTLRDEANEIERQAKEKLKQTELDESAAEREQSGMDDRDRAIFVECCIGVQKKDPVWLAQTPPAARAALQKHPDLAEKICQ